MDGLLPGVLLAGGRNRFMRFAVSLPAWAASLSGRSLDTASVLTLLQAGQGEARTGAALPSSRHVPHGRIGGCSAGI